MQGSQITYLKRKKYRESGAQMCSIVRIKLVHEVASVK